MKHGNTSFSDQQFDLAIVGGGPGGSTLAILGAQAGLKVIIIERENFPRYKIGESLLPENIPLLKRIGVFDDVEKAGFQKKPGAIFSNQKEDFSRRIDFGEAFEAKWPYAFQVDRANFDQLLLEKAKSLGVTVLQPCQAQKPILEGDQVIGLQVKTIHKTVGIKCRFLADVSGRGVFLGKHLGKVEKDPLLNQSCAYGYFDRLTYPDVGKKGDIEIIQTDVAWVWIIPLQDKRVSVGAVWTKEQIKAFDGSLKDMFSDLIKNSSMLQSRLAGATQIEETRTVADYSYQVRPFYGKGWACLGDSATFVDPIFSSGIFLSTLSSEYLFDLILPYLKKGQVPPAERLLRYEKWLQKGLKRFKKYIYGYYSPGFQKIFYSDPPYKFVLRSISSDLAGNVFQPAWWVRAINMVFWWAIARENRRFRKMQQS